AVAIVAQRALGELAVPVIVCDDTRRALGTAAAALAGQPDRDLALVGVTGTNGKTTTTFLLEGMLERAGIVGTVACRYAPEGEVRLDEPTRFTTPTPTLLQPLLGRMRDAGALRVAMEVSSHALEMGRVWGCTFRVAAFSHLTQDHLDLHGDMQSYLAAKRLLFERHLAPGGTAVINVDGDGAEAMLEAARARGDVEIVRCSRARRDVEARIEQLVCDIDGLRGELCLGDERAAFASPLLGEFNADNVLLAAACARAAGSSMQRIVAGAAAARVPGRLERVDDASGAQPAVLVDYAHTPDALQRAAAVLRPLCAGRLYVVFGCGGDRDRKKRPMMGRAAREQADVAYVTSDNPRSERPQAIIDEILPAFEGAPADSYVVEVDRRAAIEAAIAAAAPGDIVLVAGKGHEDYQILGAQRIHFDDREVAREALAART
ncbi:MAG: UDP-N-acetylmuramoyl-L-alanyl-D-glutamate--2,6-diaminopimelate ligase, partial [Myxococcales bacterium]|nr:UDP-N-acetylmuramoyl-L-alanyl-D-glutamate--2,6-diaminopimelate ligase [Myxococcales bacterium]